jgi:hypothetical protein
MVSTEDSNWAELRHGNGDESTVAGREQESAPDGGTRNDDVARVKRDGRDGKPERDRLA